MIQSLVNTRPDVIIVGGGISGVATAWELAHHGVRTTLLEAGDLASMASGWTLAGVRQSGRHAAELPLAEAAVKRWSQLAEELDADDIEYRQGGNLRLALTEDDVPVIRKVVEDGRRAGIEMHFLDSNQAIREIAPALASDIPAASWCPTDGQANPGKTMLAFAEAARRVGAEIRANTPVHSLVTSGSRVTGVQLDGEVLEAGTVIVAAGIYTPALLKPLGLDIPMNVTLVPAIQTVAVEPTLAQVLGQAGGGVALRQQVSGQFRITGIASDWRHERHTHDNVQPSLAQIRELIGAALRLIPNLEDIAVNTTWGGLIDKTPDAIPVIERTPEYDNLVIATGFSGHGFCLGPITGEILADLAVEGVTSHPIATFSRSRFAAGVADDGVTLHG
ncbi:MAG: FAD-binding oxidoreductase [Chloroflexia bacterium]|nr:FAD-binding oxidoreductase [Chloroflexia bacterium]